MTPLAPCGLTTSSQQSRITVVEKTTPLAVTILLSIMGRLRLNAPSTAMATADVNHLIGGLTRDTTVRLMVSSARTEIAVSLTLPGGMATAPGTISTRHRHG